MTRPGLSRFLRGDRTWWQEAIVLAAVYQAYESARGHLPQPAGLALQHARQLVALERALGLFWEATVQRWFLPWHPVVELFDAYYGTIHFIVPAAALLLLWLRDRPRYRRYRNAFGFMLAVALVGFAAWPVTPPRLYPPPPRFVDTADAIGGLGPLDRGSMKDDNLYAAMPSLHVGWALWCTVALVPVLRRRSAKAAAAAYPAATVLVIVATANHWVLDGVGGAAALAAGLGLEQARRRLVARSREKSSGCSLDLEPEDLGVVTVDRGHDP